LRGRPKLELARNYWDEMGRGEAGAVHAGLHHRLVVALGITAEPSTHQPVEALDRSAVISTLATNRWLQPERLGALGLIELQAGPRCRRVVTAMERLGLGEDAIAFYAEHATADPRHGRNWLDEVVAPLVATEPAWGPRIVTGARWRSLVNAAFFASAMTVIDRRRQAT